MASRIQGITVEIGGDTTKLSKALESVNKSIKGTQSGLKDVNKLLKLDPSNTELVVQKQKMLKDAIEATKEKLATLKTAAQQANEQLANGEITQQQYDALQREIVETEQNLRSLQDQAATTNATLAKIDEAGEKFQNIGSSVENVGKKFLPVTAAVTGLGTAAVKTAADFDSEMSKVSAISGATGDDFDQLRAKAREMGAKTKFSASEAASAMEYMAMAGWKTSDILSALAQEESNSISKNISWSIQKRFQEGIAFGNPRSVYGYTDGETNKDWVIVEEQARVVRFIFDEFLLGKSSYKISNELNEKGIPSSKGTKWQSESVDFILRNEKYVGDCEMQKTVTVDFLSHKTIPNNGEAPKFYVTDHHVPIINRAVWMRAQEILAHRKKNRTKKKDEKREKRVGKDVFDNLVCGKCGAPFYRRTLQARATHFEDDRCLDACRSELLAQGSSPDDYYERYYYTYPVWRCSSLKDTSPTNDGPFMGKADPDVAWHPIYIGEGDAKCPSHFVYETAVKQSFMEMLYAIKRDHEENGENAWIDSEFRMVYQKVQEHVAERDSSRKTELDEQILQLEEKMAQMQGRLKEAVERGRQKASPEIDTYERLVDDLRERLNEKMDERQQLSQEEQLLSEMKHNYDFFIRCLEALPEINKAGMKLNVNGLDTDGSCLRDFGGKARSKILSDIRRGKRKMGADRVEQAPDFLEFEKGVYFAFIKEGIVDGDVITYTTNFGVKLTSTGNSRTLMAFIGFRRCNPNKTVEVLMDGWQVNGLCIRYHREKRKEKTAHTLMIRKRKAQERALLEQEA